MDSFITADRAAISLGVSRKRIYQMIAEGKLPAMRLGMRQWRISRSGLECFIEQQMEKSRKEMGLDLPSGVRHRR